MLTEGYLYSIHSFNVTELSALNNSIPPVAEVELSERFVRYLSDHEKWAKGWPAFCRVCARGCYKMKKLGAKLLYIHNLLILLSFKCLGVKKHFPA